MYRHYYGNHYIWNNDFGKIRSFRAEGRLHIPWSWTTLSAGVENVQNYIYFNPQCLPVQHPGHIQIFSARLRQNLRFGIWNWDNTLTYQATSDSDILPLPAFTIYSNMYLYFKAFRALTVQIGVDCNYYTRYRGMMYQPATMAFPRAGRQPDIYRWICFRERVSDLQALQGALLRYVQPPERALVFPRQFLSSPLPPKPARVPLRSIDRLRRLIATVTKHKPSHKKNESDLFAGFVFMAYPPLREDWLLFIFITVR